MPTPDRHPSTDRKADFWEKTAPADDRDLPAVDDAPRREDRGSGRGWGLTALIIAAVSVVLGIVLPHFSAVFVAAGAVIAGVGMRKTAGGPRKLALAGLVTSLIVFVACVIYTVIFVTQGWAYLEQLG